MKDNVEVPKELIEDILQVIEKARASGKIRKGTNEVTKAIERGKAQLVAVAGDVSPPEIVMHLPILCREKNIPCVTIPSKQELGAALGLEVGCAAGAVVNPGDAKAGMEKAVKKLATLAKEGAKPAKPAEKPEPKKDGSKPEPKKEEKKDEKKPAEKSDKGKK